MGCGMGSAGELVWGWGGGMESAGVGGEVGVLMSWYRVNVHDVIDNV